jgi:DNA-binding MarR family transcriptional regulator/GNAT superfamily N-acetyltransferase
MSMATLVEKAGDRRTGPTAKDGRAGQGGRAGKGGRATKGGLGGRIAAVREFNRFYTRRIGVLQEGLLSSPYTLAQVRVLYELAHQDGPTATALREQLGLDRGYLSRILSGFRRHGLVAGTRAKDDGRKSLLRLTRHGRQLFAALDARAREEIRDLLAPLPESGQRRLVGAMRTVEGLLGSARAPEGSITIRPPRPGDMGWVVHRHGAVYDETYGWGAPFEAVVAEIVAAFMKHHDPARERAWIAERDGEPLGSVFLVARSKTVAQLRLLLVEPPARGAGLGQRLVDECLRFAKAAGYRRIMLWTQANLAPARHIYEKSGFRVVRSEPNHEFGKGLVSEIWEREL